jgi:hypothetical protein
MNEPEDYFEIDSCMAQLICKDSSHDPVNGEDWVILEVVHSEEVALPFTEMDLYAGPCRSKNHEVIVRATHRKVTYERTKLAERFAVRQIA